MLSLAMLMPLMLFLLTGARVASAQAVSRTSTPSWAVIDFVNRSGYGGNEMGRLAADALVVELGKSNKYEVIPRQDTMQGLENLGLTLPLDTVGIQKLGRDRSIDAVVTGEVAAISFSNNPRQATASLVMRVHDTTSGELINGTIVTGVSTPRTGPVVDDDSLVNQAIDSAAFQAVKNMIKFSLPVATVLTNDTKDTVLLNKGTSDGMYDGMKLFVVRNGSQIGRLKVINARSTDSDAAITDGGAGIRPQDRAIAIYELPSYTISGSKLRVNGELPSDKSPTAHKRDIFSGVGGILIAILATALILNLVNRGTKSGSPGGASVSGAEAVMNRVDALGGGFGAPPVGLVGINSEQCVIGTGTPADPAMDPLSYPPDWVPIAVKVTANPGNIPAFQFQEYHVYRSNFPPTLNATGLITGVPAVANFGQIPEFAQATQGPLLIFDDGQAMPPQAMVKADNQGGTLTLTISQGCVPGTGIPNVGDRFRYFVEGTYFENTNPTTGAAGQYFRNTGRTPTNFVTFIEPVLLVDTSVTNPSASNFVVTVPATRGANEYVLEMSTSALFGGAKVLEKKSFFDLSILPNNPRHGKDVVFSAVDLTKQFPGASQVFVRVGARDIQNGSGTRLNPYVYSDVIAVDVTTF
jgi:hypothetical protein